MEAFNEELPPMPLEVVNQQTIDQDLDYWKTKPPDTNFTLILEAEVED